MPDQNERLPEERRFRILKDLRRYNSVAYACGSTFTVLENPGLSMFKYAKDTEIAVTIKYPDLGIYENERADRFASHELDALVKDRLLEEFGVKKPTVNNCVAAA